MTDKTGDRKTALQALKQSLLVGDFVFWCPFCEKTWDRGGSKEGFVKSAAQAHVGGCRDVVLWNLGYVGTWCDDDLQSIEDVKAEEWFPRWRRNTLAMMASRRKAGLEPRLREVDR